MDRPTKFGDFAHGTYSRLHRPESKLTCPSPATGARGPRFHAGDEVRQPRDPLRSLANPNQARVVPFHLLLLLHHLQLPRRNRKERQAYSLLQTTMEAPATWTFGLVFQQATDRQDRTQQTEGRFSLLEPLEIHPGHTGIAPTTGQGLVS